MKATPLHFSLFQNSQVINTAGYEDHLTENSYYSGLKHLV